MLMRLFFASCRDGNAKHCCQGLLLLATCFLSPQTASATEPQEPRFASALWSMPPQAPHRVIRQPQLLSEDAQRAKDNHAFYHGDPKTIDAALTQPVWRQPYSYGYFGAKGSAHWQRHFGYHRAYTQWTLK